MGISWWRRGLALCTLIFQIIRQRKCLQSLELNPRPYQQTQVRGLQSSPSLLEIRTPPLIEELHDTPQAHVEQEQRYPTGFGCVSFEELYRATDRIVGYTLREKLGMSDPLDIDDCMQSGYLKVWKRLQRQPDWFSEKPKKYVVQAVVNYSKAQRYAHLRHQRKTVFDADADRRVHPSALAPQQIETWIDLQHALHTVAEHVVTLDTSLYLIALYTLITDVRKEDAAKLFGHGTSTLTYARKQIRSTLARELPGYGLLEDTKDALFIPKRQRPLHPIPESVSRLLITDSQPPSLSPPPKDTSSHVVVAKATELVEAPVVLLATEPHTQQETEAIANDEDSTIAEEPKYRTLWRGEATFEELLTDKNVQNVAYAKIRSIGYTDEDADDCFQLGSLNLWKKITQEPTLLSDKRAAWVGVWVALSGSRRYLWKHKQHCVSFEDTDFDMETAEERTELYPRNRTERWATFATLTDERIDFALMMNALAQEYAEAPLKLLALYSLTTSVQMKDVTSVAGVNKNSMIKTRHEVKEDIRICIDPEAGSHLDAEVLEKYPVALT